MQQRIAGLVATVVATALGGCDLVDEAEVIDFADYEGLEVVLHILPNRVSARLGSQDVLTPPGPCPVLRSDFTALLNDLEVPILERGSHVGDFEGLNECAAPVLAIENPPDFEQAVLDFGDPSRRVICDLLDLLVPRSFEQADGSDAWTFTIGAEVEVRWSPVGDLERLAFEILLFEGEQQVARVTPTITNGLLSFEVPLSVGPGSYVLEIVASPTAPAVTCDDAPARFQEQPYRIFGGLTILAP